MSKDGTFVVTGAGSGIGRALAARLVREGQFVFGLGRRTEKLALVQKELGSRFQYVAGDLAKASETERLVQAIHTWLGSRPLQGLVNNAGVFDRIDFESSDDSLWQRQFDNNLLSAVRLTRELSPRLAEGSSVLNVSSTLGLRPIANTTAYSALKAAMVNWTLGLALEWAPRRVRVNCLCPGLVDTPIHGFHAESDANSETRKGAHAAQPLGRMGRPEEIAASAWFLLSPQSAWTTGSILTVDGGISL